MTAPALGSQITCDYGGSQRVFGDRCTESLEAVAKLGIMAKLTMSAPSLADAMAEK